MAKTTFPIVSFENLLMGGYVYIVPSEIAALVENKDGSMQVLLRNGLAYNVGGDIKSVVGAIHEITDMEGAAGPRED